jgi:hypothetical protein
MVFVGCLVAACGAASNDAALFGGPNENSCSSTVCGAPGAGGAGSNSATGGAANVGGQSSSSGIAGSGGEAASSGDPGAGGSSDTGGRVGIGGQAAGSGGNADAGVAVGTGGGTQAAGCPEGDYHAVLTGQYRSSLGTNDVGATVDFSVSASGAATGSFTGPGNAKATVTGMVDCSSGALTANIENGTYGVGLAMAHFSGTLDGTYSQSTSMFGGMWTMTEPGSTTNGGTGSWSTQ